jgi:hypothetical protein
MFADERPARRADADLPRANRPALRPADRHARRLGVLGSVERPFGHGAMAIAPAAHGRLAALRTTRIVEPSAATTSSEVVAAGSVLQFPMIAA